MSSIFYYSYGHHTKGVAEIIKRKLGCDLTEIVPVKAYTGVYQKLVDAINVGWIGSTFKDIGESMLTEARVIEQFVKKS